MEQVILSYGKDGGAVHRTMNKFPKMVQDILDYATWLHNHMEIGIPVIIHIQSGKKYGKTRGICFWPHTCREGHLELQINVNTIFRKNVGQHYIDDDHIKLSDNYRVMMRIIGHEMVHIRQYAHKEHYTKLENRDGIRTWVRYWMGQEWTGAKGGTYNSYRNLPWEVEAFDREDALLSGFFRRRHLIATNRIKLVAQSDQV